MNRRRVRRRRRDGLWNRLSCVVVILFLGLACFVSYIYLNPTSSLNPFPPKTEAAGITLPTFDETLQVSLRTRTPTRQPSITSAPLQETELVAQVFTDTPEPTPIPSATPNPNGHNPATTPIPTKTLNETYPFTLQGEAKLLNAVTFNPKHGCSWQGIAGQTFDLLNRPLPGILVEVSGKLGSETLEMISMSGTILTYGEAGYEVFLSDQPIASNDTLTIRLIDEQGKPLSEQFKVDTSDVCSQNLTVVNFKKVK